MLVDINSMNDWYPVKSFSLWNLITKGSLWKTIKGTENEPTLSDMEFRLQHVKNLNRTLNELFPDKEKVNFETNLFATESGRFYIEMAK